MRSCVQASLGCSAICGEHTKKSFMHVGRRLGGFRHRNSPGLVLNGVLDHVRLRRCDPVFKLPHARGPPGGPIGSSVHSPHSPRDRPEVPLPPSLAAPRLRFSRFVTARMLPTKSLIFRHPQKSAQRPNKSTQ